MTIFTPRNSFEILREMLGKLLNRTELSDISSSSTLFALFNAVAIELANMETRLNTIRNGYSLTTSVGAELDARCAELPPGTISRKKATFGAGSVMTFSRNDASEQLIIPVGGTVQNKKTFVKYRTTEQIIFNAGEFEKTDIYVVSLEPGSLANAEAGDIDVNVDIEGIDTVLNTRSISNGISEETDGALRARALKYVKSLGKSTKDALEYLGESFISNDGQGVKFAKVYEDPNYPAYSELIVDDGNGLINQDSVANTVSGIVASNNQRVIWHEKPAIADIQPSQINLLNSSNTPKIVTTGDYVSIPERGLIYFNEGFLEEGDQWSIINYKKYQGIISELQDEVEGNSNLSNFTIPGYRAAGTRVRVLPPTLQEETLTVVIQPRLGLNVANTRNIIKNIVVSFINNLPIGEPLIISKLIQTIQNTGLVISCSIEDNDGGVITDIYPATIKTSIRTTNNAITVR
jgi:uncharacterized phage protein gp47/JayE